MQFSLDQNNRKIRPSFSGQRAICPLCNGQVIGKCGEIYVWHWQHYQDRNCDPWKEHETDWHRRWKAKFPQEWQEVVIEIYDKKHIADVKTAKGVVIEFQNSPISTATIREREEFYEKMIWVINADTFKDNFKTRSTVTSKLREEENEYLLELRTLDTEYKDELESYDKQIKNIESASISKSNELSRLKEKMETLEENCLNKTDFSQKVINTLSTEYYFADTVNVIRQKLDNSLKQQLKEIQNQITEADREIKAAEQTMLSVLNMEPITIEGKEFRLIPYKDIPKLAYQKARAILKESRKTFFLQCVDFKSESDFLNYDYKESHYDFAIDPTDKIDRLKEKQDTGKNKLLSLNEILSELKEQLSYQILQELEFIISELEFDIQELMKVLNNLTAQAGALKRNKAKFMIRMEKELTASKAEIVLKHKNSRSQIMTVNKGYYSAGWKYRRNSWNVALMPIFYDIGEDYLWYQTGKHKFKKVPIANFMSKYGHIFISG